MKYQMGLSNGKQLEAVESGAAVMVEVGMCEAESGGMHVTQPLNLSKVPHQESVMFFLTKMVRMAAPQIPPVLWNSFKIFSLC